MSETIAAVLVRRGYDDPEQARCVPRRRSCPSTTRSCSATCARPCDAIRAAIAAGTRICVHGDYDADGICATALAVLVLRELGADVVVAPAEPLRRGLRRLAARRSTRLAGEGVGLVLTVDCGVTAVEEVAHARELGLEVVVTDHHRAGRRAAGLPGRRPLPRRLPVPRALRHRRRLEARAGAARRRLGGARAAPRPRRGRDDRRRRAAPRREPRPRGRRPARARADAEARACGS